jgi:hypothetical protein
MIAGIVIPISVTLAAVFCGMWKGESDYSKALRRALDEYDDAHKEDFEKLEKRYKEDLARYKKMALDAAERADRNGAIAEGLAEDLAALKAYNPEEVEERLKKIREIRAEEEREKRLERLRRDVYAQIALSMLNSGGFGSPASAICSLADQQRISWR